jgi:hypothetical protein
MGVLMRAIPEKIWSTLAVSKSTQTNEIDDDRREERR